MPGPPRKPEIVRRQEASKQGGYSDKRPPRAEPQPSAGIPPMPNWFDAEAKRLWNLLIPELDKMGALAVIDGAAIEGACAAYARAVQCQRRLKVKGLTMKIGKDGYQQQRPEVAIEEKAWSRYRAFCSELGLTAAARVRLGLDAAADDEDEMEKLLA